MPTSTHLSPGFTDPVFQSQAAFRAVLAALSEPGTLQAPDAGILPPAGLCAAAATALLTLADYETPLFLPQALREGEAGAWLRFHCGSALVDEPAQAAFAVVEGTETSPAIADFDPGHDQFPDRSCTVFVQCAGLDGGPQVRLTGPGIPGERIIAPSGLRPGFWAEVAANAELYPLGVDLVLCHGAQMIGLPRSTRIEEVR